MKVSVFGLCVAMAALASGHCAQAQEACVAPEDAADAVTYLMPTAYDSTIRKCESQFSSESFLTSAEGRNFAEQFRALQDDSWPGTYRFIQVFIAQEADGEEGVANIIEALKPDELRPLVDVLFGQIISEEIKADSCDKIDEAVELLSPLPAKNVGGLVTFVLEQVEIKDPPICRADGTVTVGTEDQESE
ncbi:MAG: hypothetical protein AAGB23_01565 [Pseudomonadota bacterium]